ncbi:MAG: exo-alpha-sialidase, partial [Hyphomicrobiales bacterium]
MAKKVNLLIGTKKGAFVLEGNGKRDAWKLRGPFCEAWPINHVESDAGGNIYAGGGNEWFGPAVW